jgi:hypothetical protein
LVRAFITGRKKGGAWSASKDDHPEFVFRLVKAFLSESF